MCNSHTNIVVVWVQRTHYSVTYDLFDRTQNDIQPFDRTRDLFIDIHVRPLDRKQNLSLSRLLIGLEIRCFDRKWIRHCRFQIFNKNFPPTIELHFYMYATIRNECPFFWVHGEMNRRVEQPNCRKTASRFTLFVCQFNFQKKHLSNIMYIGMNIFYSIFKYDVNSNKMLDYLLIALDFTVTLDINQLLSLDECDMYQ